MSADNENEATKMEVDNNEDNNSSDNNSSIKGDAENNCIVLGGTDPSTPTAANAESKLTHSKSKSKLTSAQKLENAKKRQEEKVIAK